MITTLTTVCKGQFHTEEQQSSAMSQVSSKIGE